MSDEWLERAACRGMATAVFFPSSGEPHDEAQAVCASCPVRRECRAAGQGEHGVWGGTPERARGGTRRMVRFCVVCGAPVARGRTCDGCLTDDAVRARRYRQRRSVS